MRFTILSLIALAAHPVPTSAAALYVPNELLVIRAPGNALVPAPNGALRTRSSRANAALGQFGFSRWEPLDGAHVATADPGAWFKLTSTRPDFDPVAAARELVASGAVSAAAPNLLLKLSKTIPNDTYVSTFQYWVDDPGNADVQLADAWDIAKGDTSVTIGIMDTGVDRTHPDLAAQIWRNWAEIPGNGIDDDGDGYIDDVNGWDFGNDDNDPNPHAVFDPSSGIDIGFHGTFVAGLAAAATDNTEGIAGAGWRCRILPLKVADSTGTITLGATTLAFRYAWAHHVSVLNMSIGTPDTTARGFFQAMVDSATDRGVLCVAAAGNDGVGDPSFPAACDRVLSVAATDESNQRASFSNWGPTVDVAAPGVTMWSAICQNYTIDDYSQIFYIYLFGWDGQDPYMSGDGTSFSCPVASGVCGIVRARWPYLTPDQVRQHVIDTGDVVAYDEPIGRKLNALEAVRVGVLAAPVVAHAVMVSASPNPFRDASSIVFTLPRAGDSAVELFDADGRRVQTLLRGALAAGQHRVAWDGRDTAGAAAAPGLYFARVTGPGVASVVRVVRIQ